MRLATLPLRWRPREPPLVPCGVVAVDDCALRLARKLLRQTARIAKLRCVAGTRLLIFLGDQEDLPWIDGALYIGKDPVTPYLLLPTCREPSVPLDLLEEAVQGRITVPGPFVMFPDPLRVASVFGACPPDEAALFTWLEQQ